MGVKKEPLVVFLSHMRKSILFSSIIFCSFTGQAQGIAKMKMADVVRLFNNKSDTIYVVNFWASFCKPCVAEIPDFIRITDKYKNQKVKLLLVSVDLPSYYPAKIAAFAKQHHFNTNIAWLNETNADYFCPVIDSSWSGTIPATIIVNAKTGYKKFWEGDVKANVFTAALQKAIVENLKPAAERNLISPMIDATVVDYAKENTSCYRGSADNITFTSKDSAVYTVCNGIVNAVVNVDDMYLVIIKKDSLFYAYSNLKAAFVKKRDTVKADQLLGYAALNFDGILSVDLYLFDERIPVKLTKNDFKIRSDINSTRFTPMIGMEPE
jgi:thiol-disulfide isomerase/thioredoxin